MIQKIQSLKEILENKVSDDYKDSIDLFYAVIKRILLNRYQKRRKNEIRL